MTGTTTVLLPMAVDKYSTTNAAYITVAVASELAVQTLEYWCQYSNDAKVAS